MVILMLMGFYIPFLYGISFIIVPIVIVVLYVRQGFKIASSAVVASTILTCIMYEPLEALAMCFLYGVCGLTLGLLRYEKN